MWVPWDFVEVILWIGVIVVGCVLSYLISAMIGGE